MVCDLCVALPHLVGMSRKMRLTRKVSVTTAFVDDCEVGDVYFFASWVSEAETWLRFADKWQDVLDATPPILYFKHNEALGLKGQFDGFTEAERADKMSALVDVICAHDMFGVTMGVRGGTYREAFKSDRVSRKHIKSVLRINHPYLTCFISTHQAVIQEHVLRNGNGKVDFIFDKCPGLFKEAKALLEEVLSYVPAEISEVSGIVNDGDDKDIAALQAADLLAGQWAHELTTRHRTELMERMRLAHDIGYGKAYPPYFHLVPRAIKFLEDSLPMIEEARRLAKLFDITDPDEQ